MKTSFDLPEPLLRRAKAAAAQQGRPLRDLVAEALSDKLDALPESAVTRAAANDASPNEFDAYMATLVQQPDGSWINPNGIDDDEFFKILDSMREGDRAAADWRPRDPFATKR